MPPEPGMEEGLPHYPLRLEELFPEPPRLSLWVPGIELELYGTRLHRLSLAGPHRAAFERDMCEGEVFRGSVSTPCAGVGSPGEGCFQLIRTGGSEPLRFLPPVGNTAHCWAFFPRFTVGAEWKLRPEVCAGCSRSRPGRPKWLQGQACPAASRAPSVPRVPNSSPPFLPCAPVTRLLRQQGGPSLAGFWSPTCPAPGAP